MNTTAEETRDSKVVRLVRALMTEHTCGFSCWEAREDICRCSCGGANHGCLRSADGVQPQRMAKIDGVRYKLEGVSAEKDLADHAREINRLAGYKSIEKPTQCKDCITGEVWFDQYYYCWSTTDPGAPARLKNATQAQIEKWPEMKAYRGHERNWYYRNTVRLLWVREVMPEKPKNLKVSRETGEPIADQIPPNKHW